MKWKTALLTAGPLVLLAAHHALAATSGWPVDATVTSTTTFLGTDVANGLFYGGSAGLAAAMTAGAEWGRSMNHAVGAMGGGSILTNANGIATVAGISPGATIRLLNHPALHHALHAVKHLIG